MIDKIILGKKYKVVDDKYTRTPLFVHNAFVFYEHDLTKDSACSSCPINEFKKSVEEIPEAPVEWFEVVYKIKGEKTRPSSSSPLFKSKEDFLNFCERNEEDFEFIKLRKVEL